MKSLVNRSSPYPSYEHWDLPSQNMHRDGTSSLVRKFKHHSSPSNSKFESQLSPEYSTRIVISPIPSIESMDVKLEDRSSNHLCDYDRIISGDGAFDSII